MKLGRYEVLKELGQGGMATAFLALAPGGQKVVLKTPHLKSDDLNDRLRDEARIGIRLAHPALVETLDLFEHEGKPVLVVAFIDGVSVDGLRRHARLPAAAVARIGWQIAQGLHAVHCATDETGRSLHMVHRDVTAPNVLVDKSGDARLIDLGIARSVENLAATEPGTIKGTVRYLAPELLQGLPPTPKSDLWGLGCVLFEAATGRPIHEGAPAQTMISILRNHPLEKPEAATIAPELREVFAILFERDAAKRIGDGYELAELFQRAEAELGDGESELAAAVIDVAGAQDDDEIAKAQAGGGPVEENKIPELTGQLLEEAPARPSGPMPAPRPRSPFGGFPATGSDPFAGGAAARNPAHSGGFPVPPSTGVHPASTGAFASDGSPSPSGLGTGPQPAVSEIPRPGPRWAVPPGQTGSFPTPPATFGDVSSGGQPIAPGPVAGPPPPSVPSSTTPITSPTPIPGVPNLLAQPIDFEVEQRPRKHSNIMRVDPAVRSPRTQDLDSPFFLYAKRAFVLAAVAIALGLAWRFVVKPMFKDDAPPSTSTGSLLSLPDGENDAEASFVRKTIAATADLPACWKGDEGWQFVYTDARGRNVAVDRIKQVPKEHRSEARCVRTGG